jgi:hypothetical protein
MKEDYDYKQVPANYLHCLNAQCPRSAKCLHHQVALRAGQDVASFRLLNPAHIAGREANCPYFEPDRTERFAIGIDHILDGLLHETYLSVKYDIIKYFGRHTYDNIRQKKRLITPEEQEGIRRLFKRHGIPKEPVFDEYFDDYPWTMKRVTR